MIIKQISIFVENRPGRLAEITGIIAENNINIRALSIADTTNFGILRIIVEEPYKVERILKDNNMTVSVTGVISVSVPDKPGGLANILKLLADEGIAVEYMYAFVSKQHSENAYVVMKIENEFAAMNILKDAGYTGLDIE